ncbi:hypothetical protein FHT79_003244 [Rhizobium sp. BK212]|uniref:hypothetical protein n=1 Tax=Rhizobium sp. BK212 TaxID=2587074 RepID=UPI001617E591|nr:hypothetical protein [Rhizobium sp. BK212]MBB4216057.1 hypothetical protein [Rhizobium sp. BK212]
MTFSIKIIYNSWTYKYYTIHILTFLRQDVDMYAGSFFKFLIIFCISLLFSPFPKQSLSATFPLCADFSIFPPNYSLPNNLAYSGYTFSENDPQGLWSTSSAGTGLQFRNSGFTAKLPTITQNVHVIIGAFATPVRLSAKDAQGSVIFNQTVPADNTMRAVDIDAKEIVSVIGEDGNNEGILQEICFDVTTN